MRVLIKEKLSPNKYKTPEGYLVCVDAILARTGKQQYRRNELYVDSDDDSIVDVDRPYDEVFSEQTIASFENKPFVNEHPNEDVNVHNHKDYAVGFVRDVHKGEVDGEPVLLGNLIITDEETIAEIESGEKTELSCGYDCDITDDENPCQRNIRGNHVALCKAGRAGIARIQDSKINDSLASIVFKPFDSDKNYNKYKFANDYNIKQMANKLNLKVDIRTTRSGWYNEFTDIRMDVTGDKNQIEKLVNYCITKLNLEIDEKQVRDSQVEDSFNDSIKDVRALSISGWEYKDNDFSKELNELKQLFNSNNIKDGRNKLNKLLSIARDCLDQIDNATSHLNGERKDFYKNIISQLMDLRKQHNLKDGECDMKDKLQNKPVKVRIKFESNQEANDALKMLCKKEQFTDCDLIFDDTVEVKTTDVYVDDLKKALKLYFVKKIEVKDSVEVEDGKLNTIINRGFKQASNVNRNNSSEISFIYTGTGHLPTVVSKLENDLNIIATYVDIKNKTVNFHNKDLKDSIKDDNYDNLEAYLKTVGADDRTYSIYKEASRTSLFGFKKFAQVNGGVYKKIDVEKAWNIVNGKVKDSEELVEDGYGILSSGQEAQLKRYCQKYEADFKKAYKEVENLVKNKKYKSDSALEMVLEDISSGVYDSVEDTIKDSNFEEIFWGIYDNTFDLPFRKTIDYITKKYEKKIWGKNEVANLRNLSSSEQRDIIEFAKKEALSWDNLDIYNSHARYKSNSEIQRQLKSIFGVTNRNLKDESIKDRKSPWDVKVGDIITHARLANGTRKYKVLKVEYEFPGRPEHVWVRLLETPDLKYSDDPYAFRPVGAMVSGDLTIIDSVKDSKVNSIKYIDIIKKVKEVKDAKQYSITYEVRQPGKYPFKETVEFNALEQFDKYLGNNQIGTDYALIHSIVSKNGLNYKGNPTKWTESRQQVYKQILRLDSCKDDMELSAKTSEELDNLMKQYQKKHPTWKFGEIRKDKGLYRCSVVKD